MAEKRKRISRKTALRSNIIILFFAAVAVVIACRLAYLQIYEYDYYKEKVMNEITVETKVNPERGTIYDSGGGILATNSTVYLCFISPQDIIDAMAKSEEDENDSGIYAWAASDGSQYNVKMDELISRFMADTLGVDFDDVMKKTAKNITQ